MFFSYKKPAFEIFCIINILLFDQNIYLNSYVFYSFQFFWNTILTVGSIRQAFDFIENNL